MTSDIGQVENGITTNISMITRAMVTIIADLVIVFILCWQLSLITLIGVLLSSSVNFFFMGKQRALQKEIQALKSVMTTTASESCMNIRTVKAFSNEETESKKFMADSKKVFNQGKSKALLTGFDADFHVRNACDYPLCFEEVV